VSSYVHVPRFQTNILNRNAPDLEAECVAYEQQVLAIEELAAIAEKITLALRIKPLIQSSDSRVSPSSMASRILAFVGHPNATILEDLLFARIQSRIGNSSITV
jgi:hypothetical protein